MDRIEVGSWLLTMEGFKPDIGPDASVESVLRFDDRVGDCRRHIIMMPQTALDLLALLREAEPSLEALQKWDEDRCKAKREADKRRMKAAAL